MNNINTSFKKIYSLLILTFLCFLILINKTYSEEKIGSVVALQGEIIAINTDDEKRTLDIYDDIFLFDEIVTNNSSSVTIQYDDNSTVIIKSSSSLTITEFVFSIVKKKFLGIVKKGKVIIESGKIAKSQEGSMEIQLPTMILGIKGTRFNMKINPDGTSEVGLSEDSFGEVGTINISSEGKVQTLYDTDQVISANIETGISERPKTDDEKKELVDASNDLIEASSIDENLIQEKLEEKLANGNLLDANNDGIIDLADLDTVKTNMEVIHSDNVNETIRTDHGIEHERQIMLSDSTILNERIYTGISGNKISKFSQYFHRPDDWNRQYGSYHLLFLFCTWGSLTLWILSMVIGMYYLIENANTNKYEISWKLLIGFILFILILSITHFLNEIPITIARYRGTESYMAFWVEKIGHLLNNYTILIVFMSVAVCSLSLINSTIKNLFSLHNRKKLGHGLLISTMATFGAILLHKPIKYVLYENFPSYLDMSHWFNMNNVPFSII